VKVTLWGTRGSIPCPGPDTIRYGGNTPCVEVRGRDGGLVILDAGTGIRRLGPRVNGDTRRLDILLTHLHLDHIQGLAFFEPLYRPGLDVHIWGPASPTHDLRTRIAQYLSPPLFPVRIRDLPCRLTFHDVPLGAFSVGGFEVSSALVCHPGPTVGYRVASGRAAVAYLPDHEPALGARRAGGRWMPPEEDWISGLGLARSAALLIHDAQYTAAEYDGHVGWGHTAIPDALTFAAIARAVRLVLFHHDPERADDTLDALLRTIPPPAPGLDVIPGQEGLSLRLV
jgi:phosphoribosyl 1,2-cyclic phosphodiesterase